MSEDGKYKKKYICSKIFVFQMILYTDFENLFLFSLHSFQFLECVTLNHVLMNSIYVNFANFFQIN